MTKRTTSVWSIAAVWVTAGALALAASPARGLQATGSGAASQTAGVPKPVAPAEYRALVDKYCVTCHSEKSPLPASAPLLLDKANLDDPGSDPFVWERVVRKLGLGAMPPQNAAHPDPQSLTVFRSWLAASLDRAADRANNPGRVLIHRLNRTEYANAVRDLLGVSVDVSQVLPPDGSEFGFDNIAAVLKTSPSLLEQYVTAAMRVSAAAIGDRAAEPEEHKYIVRLDFTQTDHVEGLPLGTRGGTLVHFNFPADGEYLLAGALFRPIDSADTGIEGQLNPHEFQILVDGEVVHSAFIGGIDDHLKSRENMTAAREEVAGRMKVRVPITAGPHDVGFTFVARSARSQDLLEPLQRSSQDLHVGAEAAKLTAVTITGPYSVTGVAAASPRQSLSVCRSTSEKGSGGAGPASAADEPRCARQILSRLARRAFRRPVTDEDLQPVLAFYDQGRARGTFDDGIRAAISRILTSPSFLYRTEQDPAALAGGTAHRITDLELASRLSFFLWSSIPDDELLNLAVAGKLRTPGTLERQVRRMIADPRAQALTTNFPDQWLALRNLEKSVPDFIIFPDWDLNARQSAVRETELLFDSIVHENRSTLDLLNADYTFLNERLATHYRVPGVYGSAFRRVPVTDPNRRGLLGQASILTLTSDATRTSPVGRAKWILTNLLNSPPPPPPPNVPALTENKADTAPKSVRERLEAHRANPVCASCHRNMDPIGFALENFNAVGQWRAVTESGASVDATGVLLDGTKIDGPVALRGWLTEHPDVFVGTVTEKLLTYALGRGLEPLEMPVVRDVLRKAAADNYRMQAIILGIVESRPFQMRIKPASAGEIRASIAQ
jgi:mono/diheme cytochrome c family protein